MTAQQLIGALADAFDYTEDNNRDLLLDPTFPMAQVTEELEVQRSYQFLISYITRNEDMINLNLTND